MKGSSVLVVSLLLVVVASSRAVAQQSARVRPLDDVARAALARGVLQSALFRDLVFELERSDVIVHVLTTFSLPDGAIGTTRLSGVGDQHRYLRVTIDAYLSPEESTAILGHELQHACEIARSKARDSDAVRALYQLIGQRVSETRFAYETQAAIAAGNQVRFDLHHSPRRFSANSQEQ